MVQVILQHTYYFLLETYNDDLVLGFMKSISDICTYFIRKALESNSNSNCFLESNSNSNKIFKYIIYGILILNF